MLGAALACSVCSSVNTTFNSSPRPGDMIYDTGAGIYACKASVDLFGLEKNDLIPEVQDIITVGEFYERAAGGEIIFT
jgi:predicted peroxiredoxin